MNTNLKTFNLERAIKSQSVNIDVLTRNGLGIMNLRVNVAPNGIIYGQIILDSYGQTKSAKWTKTGVFIPEGENIFKEHNKKSEYDLVMVDK